MKWWPGQGIGGEQERRPLQYDMELQSPYTTPAKTRVETWSSGCGMAALSYSDVPELQGSIYLEYCPKRDLKAIIINLLLKHVINGCLPALFALVDSEL